MLSISILGPYLSSIGRSESHWARCGLAIKVTKLQLAIFRSRRLSDLKGTVFQIAQNLGMSRLGPELGPEATAEQVSKHFGTRYTMAARREEARRVWFSLVRALGRLVFSPVTDQGELPSFSSSTT
jgi:hypothetical protein